MNNQFKFITDLLPQIDSVVIPDNTFDVAYSNARPVVRDETHQVAQSVAVETGLNRPTAVKGLANTGPKTMQVSISTADGLSEEAKAAEKERKERIAKQNALPSWMSQSTITGDSYTGSANQTPGLVLPKDEGDSKGETAKQSTDAKEQADIDDYFARLKAEQAAEAARKAAEDDDFESGDEDEDDFEDVVATNANSATGTPHSTVGAAMGAVPAAPSPLRQSSVPLNSSLKREASASGTSTGVTSPVGGTPGSDGRPPKKVKLEAPPPEEPEDEDDMEFEDV
jgi:transcription initiation factor TFIIE subunit alpha